MNNTFPDITFIDDEEALELSIRSGWYLKTDTSLYLHQSQPFESERDALSSLEDIKPQEHEKIKEEYLPTLDESN